MGGSPLAKVMVLLAGRLKTMLFASPLLAALMASRSEPVPTVSPVEVTVNVWASACPASAASRTIRSKTRRRGRPNIAGPP
jgi:hypothetical protein